MNKKLLLGAALLVGIGTTLTSCVDSFESASVTNVREAKAEQLKSIADFNKAQAQAALIVANAQQAAQAANEAYQQAQAAYLAAQAEAERAEADLKKAQAAYWNAQAALLDAQTDAQRAKLQAELDKLAAELEKLQIANEQAKVDLESSKDQLAYDKARLANEIEKLKFDLEKAQILLEQEKLALDKSIREAKDEEANYYGQKYKKAAEEYFKAKKNLANANADLIALQADLQSAESVLAKQIADKKNTQTEEQTKLAADKDLLTFYQQYAGQKVTPEMLAEAIDKENAAKTELDKADKALEGAKKAFEDATAALDDSEFKKLMNQTIYNSETQGSSSYKYYYWEDSKEYEGKVDYYTCEIVYIPSTEDNDSYSGAVPTNCRGKWVVKTGKGLKNYSWSSNYVETPVYTYTPIYDVPKYDVVTVSPSGSHWEWKAIDNQVELHYTSTYYDYEGNYAGTIGNSLYIYPAGNGNYLNGNIYNQNGEYNWIYGYNITIQQLVQVFEEMQVSYVEQTYYTPIEAGLKAWKDFREAEIKANPDDIEGAKKNITTAKEFVASAKDIYNTYVSLDDALNEYYKAVNAEAALPTDAPQADKTAAAQLVSDKDKAVKAIQADMAKDDFTKKVADLEKYLNDNGQGRTIDSTYSAEMALHSVNNILNSANQTLATYENKAANTNFKVEKVDELVTNIKENALDSETLVKAVNKASEDEAEAAALQGIAYAAWDNNQQAVNSLVAAYDNNEYVGGNSVFNQLLSELETEIKGYEESIAQREIAIAGLEEDLKNIGDTATKYGDLIKVLIAKQEATIQEYTDLVDMWKGLYETAKAALEAALGGSESETPAE